MKLSSFTSSGRMFITASALFCAASVLSIIPAEAAKPKPIPNLTTFHYFTAAEGSTPLGFTTDGSKFYGVTETGGKFGFGTIYSINADGSGYQILHSFADESGTGSPDPCGILTLSEGTLYGTTRAGGVHGFGSVFSISTNADNYQVIYPFLGGTNGVSPFGGVIIPTAGSYLYGTTEGATNGVGTVVYRLNPTNSAFSVLHRFADTESPEAGLVYSDGTLFGTSFLGGNTNSGNTPYGSDGFLFGLSTTGTGYRVYHFFNYDDGSQPLALTVVGNTLFGVTYTGGLYGYGSLFSVANDGTGFNSVHSFSGTTNGSYPAYALTLDGDYLYGTTTSVNEAPGTLFTLQTNGTSFKTIRSVPFNLSLPSALSSSLQVSTRGIYGTTANPGSGTLFFQPFIAQTISFPSIHSKVFGAPPFVLSATSSARSPVTFSVTGPASINGTTLSILGAGTVTITANASGNGLFTSAPTLARSFVVAKAPQTISVPIIATKIVTSPEFSIPSPTSTSGLPVKVIYKSGPAKVFGDNLNGIPLVTLTGKPGVVVLIASQVGNANYLAAPSKEILIPVVKAPVP